MKSRGLSILASNEDCSLRSGARLFSYRPQTGGPSVFNVLGFCAPLEVFGAIVDLVAVQMVNLVQSTWIRIPRHRNQAMDHVRFGFVVSPKIYAQISPKAFV